MRASVSLIFGRVIPGFSPARKRMSLIIDFSPSPARVSTQVVDDCLFNVCIDEAGGLISQVFELVFLEELFELGGVNSLDFEGRILVFRSEIFVNTHKMRQM